MDEWIKTRNTQKIFIHEFLSFQISLLLERGFGYNVGIGQNTLGKNMIREKGHLLLKIQMIVGKTEDKK